MPSIARVTRCTTEGGDHESVSRCDVMRQRKIRRMVKAGQDSCSVHSLNATGFELCENQIAVVATPRHVRFVETFEIPLCKFKKAELSICENIKFMKHIWSIL